MKQVSLETAKKLKEAGWPQGNDQKVYFLHEEGGEAEATWKMDPADCCTDWMTRHIGQLAAPDATELLEKLPNIKTKTNTCNLKMYRCDDGFWEVGIYDRTDDSPIGGYFARHLSLVEALALLWLELKSKNLI